MTFVFCTIISALIFLVIWGGFRIFKKEEIDYDNLIFILFLGSMLPTGLFMALIGITGDLTYFENSENFRVYSAIAGVIITVYVLKTFATSIPVKK